jgi:hypothetical protein
LKRKMMKMRKMRKKRKKNIEELFRFHRPVLSS